MEQANIQTGSVGFNPVMVEQAIKMLYPFSFNNPISELPMKELLRGLSIFRNQRVDGILRYATTETIHHLAQRSTEEILKMAEEIGTENRHKLNWGEYQEKIIAVLEAEFPDLFEKVKYDIQQQNLSSKLSSAINSASQRVQRVISALLSTEEEANGRKEEIRKLFAEINQKITDSECEDIRKVELFAELEKALQVCLDYVDVKLAEEPVKACYYNTGSGVAVKLKWNKNSYTYTVGRKREIRWNRGADAQQYPLIISASYIMDFLCQNNVRDEDILVDPNSVDQFYIFNKKISANLTPAFVREWYNYDCPNLVRCSPNKERGETMLGMPICHFEKTLVEASWSANYIDEDITEEEVKLLSKGYEHTGITKSMRNVLKARELEEAGKSEEIRTYVHGFDTRIQEVVDNHKDEVMEFLKATFEYRVVMNGTDGTGEIRFNDNFGLDCGFTNISTKDPVYMENRHLLKAMDSSESFWMNVRLPHFSQSTTFNRKQFEKVKQVVLREIGIELYANFQLD